MKTKGPRPFETETKCILSTFVALKVTSPRLSQRGEVFKLLFPAQKQKRDVQDYELETNKQNLEIIRHSHAHGARVADTITVREHALNICFVC